MLCPSSRRIFPNTSNAHAHFDLRILSYIAMSQYQGLNMQKATYTTKDLQCGPRCRRHLPSLEVFKISLHGKYHF